MRHSRIKVFFAFVMVFAALLVVFALFGAVNPVGIAVITVLSGGVTLWIARAPVASDQPDDEAP